MSKEREKILGIINKIEYRSIGGKSFHNRLADAILTYLKSKQQKIEQLENQLYISDKAHQRVCAENVELEKETTKLKERVKELAKEKLSNRFCKFRKIKKTINQINKKI